MLMFHFTKPASHASARQGLDMLLMAVSLEQTCVAVYSGDALEQLLVPNNNFDPLKKTGMLDSIFDFQEIYVSAESLTLANLTENDFRVPVRVCKKEMFQQFKDNAKHLIQF